MQLLGPVSEYALNSVGVYTKKDTERLGTKKVFEMVQDAGFKPSRNLLYALEGAINDMSWGEVTSRLREAGVIKSKNRY